MAKMNFDATSVEPSVNMSTPLPAGAYTVEVTGAELRDLRSGKGQGLNVEYTVIDPAPHARRKIWSNFNINHESPTAEQIGREQLAALCLAVGIQKLEDTDELFGKILRIETGFGKGDYADKAEVKAWMAAGAPTTSAPKPAAPQASSPSQPWKRAA